MENTLVLERTDIFNDFVKAKFNEKLLSPEISRNNRVLENIRSEGGEDFFQYLHRLQFAKEPNLMALSSMHHYYYDFNDLKGIKTLINLKKLNNIKHLDSFLRTVIRILPPKTYFVGCFKNNNQNGSVVSFYQSAKFINGLINYIDSRTDRSLSKKDVTRILEEHYLKVVDITDINGMTYFCSQNIRKFGN
jgi:hypothetical protein